VLRLHIPGLDLVLFEELPLGAGFHRSHEGHHGPLKVMIHMGTAMGMRE